MTTIDLDGPWVFRGLDTYHTRPEELSRVVRWMPSMVPGTVHTDLLAAGVIPDPFAGTNELRVQWVDRLCWVYRREFDVPGWFLRQRKIDLCAEGLDTYAHIRINGSPAGASENMHVAHRFPVRALLREGRNTIDVHFDSPTVRSRALEKKEGALRVALEPHRVYARKAQYSFSWDWGPQLTTSGIWRSIRLEGYSAGRLAEPKVVTTAIRRAEAVLSVSIAVEHAARKPLRARVFMRGDAWTSDATVRVRDGKARWTVRVPHPRLWWPNGLGEQPLYTAVFTLLDGEEVVDERRTTFGIRTVRLMREKDAEGESFIMEVNGTKVFAKGADWIPSDSFVPRIPASTYEALLTRARDAHMNMIRVWGGGIYEQEVFYDLCDRLGLLVWQDFLFACGEYPERRWFLRSVEDEARKAVRRLRNHPSIALWCGNNECEWLFCTENPDKTADDMTGATIFRDLLPRVVAEEDGTRPYWRSSPFGTGFPNAESNGNHHQWTVWSAWKDYVEYERDTARFVTEFGFQAPATAETLERVIAPEDRRPLSAAMDHHNKQVEGPERLLRFLAAHHELTADFREFIFRTQLVQAEALKCAVEHWRRRKFRTAGVLFWQLNDCWPVSSWAVIDSELRPKLAYYYARRFYAPVLASLRREGNDVSAWVTNDLLTRAEGTLTVTLRSFDGHARQLVTRAVRIAANRSVRALRIPAPALDASARARSYLHVELRSGGKVTAENRLYFAEPKHQRLPKTRLRLRVVRTGEGRFGIYLSSSAFARAVTILLDDPQAVFSDNCFDLDAGATRCVELITDRSLGALRKMLTVHSLQS